MTTYKDQLQLASKASEAFGPDSGATLMDMLVASERVEIEVTKLRAELDGRFVSIDQQFVAADRKLLETETRLSGRITSELKGLRRFVLATAIASVGVVLASVIGLASLILTTR